MKFYRHRPVTLPLIVLLLQLLLPTRATAVYKHPYLAPVNQSGTYQVDCPGWFRDRNAPAPGCRGCPRAASFLRLNLTDVEQLPWGSSSHTIRMHYTGEYRQQTAEKHRSPCQGEYTCVRWIGYRTYPLSGYFDWNFDRSNGVYYLDGNVGLSGQATSMEPLDHNGYPIVTMFEGVEFLPGHKEEFGKAAGDALVTLFPNPTGQLWNGSGGWDTWYDPNNCACHVVTDPDWEVMPRLPYYCDSTTAMLGSGSLFFTGDETLIPSLKGSIAAKLRSSLALVMPEVDQDPRTIERATATLYLQDGFIRDQFSNESDAEYRTYVASIGRTAVGKPIVVTAQYDSSVLWQDIAANHLVKSGELSVWQDLYYTIEIRDAETDELDLNQSADPLDPNVTVTTFFAGNAKYNVKVDLAEPIEEHVVELAPFDNITTKEGLVTSLSLICPSNYTAPENLVQLYLNQLKNGTVPQTAEAREGLKRAILAERTVLFGARLSRDLIAAFMDGFSNLLQNLIEEFTDKKGTRKGLAKQKKEMEVLEADAQILKQRLQNQGWDRFSQANLDSVKGDMSALGDTNSMLVHKVAKALKITLKYTFAALRASLVATNLEGGAIDDFLGGLQKVVFTVLDSGIHQGIGSLEQFVKFAIGQVAERGKEDLFDSILPASYSALTAKDLTYSQQLMESWDRADLATYQADRTTVNWWLTRLGGEATAALVAATYAGFANDAGDLVETAGDVGQAHPIGRFAKILGKITKYAANGVQFVVPAGMIMRAYDFTGTAVEVAFNSTPRPALSAGQAGITAAATLTGKNTNLLSAVNNAELALDTVLGQISGHLANDFIPDAIALTSGASGETLQSARKTFERTMSHFIMQASEITSLRIAATSNFNGMVPQNIAVDEQLSYLVEDLFRHYLTIISLGYDGPSDPLYAAERTRLRVAIAAVREAIANLGVMVDAFATYTPSAQVTALASIDEITIRSDATGTNAITMSPESFSLTAHVANISTASLADLSALLTVHSPAGSITLLSSPELVVGSGTLGADDGTYGSGTDEADVVWQFTFDGNLDVRERIVFVVELLEAGTEPTSFDTMSALEMLRYDITVRDADLDGVPDDWELANGLDPTVDDSEDDADRDGVANWREYELGTLAAVADSDGDGLKDGEELTGGTDGYVTDPLSADSDGDGIPDDADSYPLDADPLATGAVPGEPIVAVDRSSVSISEDERFAIVTVTNAGAGTLSWTAVSSNEALAITSPGRNRISGDGAKLLVQVPAGFQDPGACASTSIRVMDLGGATKDYKDINVTVASAVGCAMCGDASGDGQVTATDALMALQTAIGINGCALDRCDTNGDGQVTATDALLVLNYAVGNISALGCA